MANSDPLIGKQVGNYHILAEINSGSFGSVYRGKHIIFEDDPVVAIKLLHASLYTQQERTEFIKEAQLLKKFRHPYNLRYSQCRLSGEHSLPCHRGTPQVVRCVIASVSTTANLACRGSCCHLDPNRAGATLCQPATYRAS